MIRSWFRAFVKKILSGKGLLHAPRRARRDSARLRLEALEDRLACSISKVGLAWPSSPVAVATKTVVIASDGDPAPPPSPTAPVGSSGVGQGAPGLGGLLRDVLGVGPRVPATQLGAPTTPIPPASGPVLVLPPVALADQSFTVPRGAPPAAEGMVPRPADLSFVPPPSVDRAEDGAAQRPLPGPSARTEGIEPAHQPNRSNWAVIAPVSRHDRSPTPPTESREPQSGERHSAPADFRADTPLVVEERAASSSAEQDLERLPARVPDLALLRRYVADGDQAAFRTIFRRHERVVLVTCQRVLGDPHLAQEASQATFMILARKAALLDGRKPLAAWLCKVAFRAALRLRAALANRRRRERETARLSAVVFPLSADLESKEIFQALTEELHRLPEKYRRPLVLCYLDGRTHGEAAQEIGLPRGSMAKRIHEGLLRLRERLVNRGFIV